MHHYNSTQYCQKRQFSLIFPFLQTNITKISEIIVEQQFTSIMFTGCMMVHFFIAVLCTLRAATNKIKTSYHSQIKYWHNVYNRVTTCLENLDMLGNLTNVREMSGILLKVREVSGKTILSWKSGLKLFIVSCVFGDWRRQPDRPGIALLSTIYAILGVVCQKRRRPVFASVFFFSYACHLP